MMSETELRSALAADPRRWKIGDRVTWENRSRSGYGYYRGIPGVVVKIGWKRVTIEVAQRPMIGTPPFVIADKTRWVRARKSVDPAKLTRRDDLCDELGETEAANV
jgi:hypothetical protein